MKKTGAVLVAAGLSSRMKAFKPLLPFGKSTISLHTVLMLKKMGLDPIVVVTGFQADKLEAHLSFTGVRFVKNERFFETQMFDSVKLGIQEINEECDRILIMPMDIPAILPDTFAQVLGTDALVVRTKYKEHTGHPIVLESKLAKQLLSYQGENGLKGAVENSGVSICDIEVQDEGVRKDVDTPEEYKQLIQWNYERGNGFPIRTKIEVKLEANEIFFTEQTAQLLELIDQTGSKQEACNQMELSYSKGSNMIKKAEQQLGYALIDRWTGGTGGGGSILTAEGKKLLIEYKEMELAIQKNAEQVFSNFKSEYSK